MLKVLVVLALISCTAAAGTSSFNKKSNFLQEIGEDKNAIDWCPECVNGFGQLISGVLDVILEYGVLGSCGDLCDLVTNVTKSDFVGLLCSLGCDVFGIKEFIKLIEEADLDPIYYCEDIKLCPVNDDGDAKFLSFVILPETGRIGTKFDIDYIYVSKNGTGTGEIIVEVATVDKINITANFLREAQKPGSYGQRLVLDATPDPECDPTEQQCELWLPGTYTVTITLCNGQCGSHHPHTKLYDIVNGTFHITE